MGTAESKPSFPEGMTPPEGCPMHDPNAPKDGQSGTFVHADAARSHNDDASSGQGGCPVMHPEGNESGEGGGRRPVYNVYSQEINPDNQMPVNPNQLPSAQQQAPLSTDRVVSSIPKGGTDDETWSFPSPQMFYNALARKNKMDDEVREEDMAMVVAIHNNMNERTWRMVEEWETLLHADDCGNPKLLRFIGRPHELSPRARILTWLGKAKPFDRHDWFVDRCGSTHRYIIDFYYDEAKASDDAMPELHDMHSIQSISMHVRPALDSVGAVVDVARMALLRLTSSREELSAKAAAILKEKLGVDLEKMVPRVKTGAAAGSIDLTTDDFDVNTVEAVSQRIGIRCEAVARDLDACDSEEACMMAAIKMKVCMAGIICPGVAKSFNDNMEDALEDEFAKVTSCLDAFQEKAAEVMAASLEQQ